MSYTPYPSNIELNTDAGGRQRTSQMSTLFDGKSLSGDETFLWENVGTGTGTFGLNIYNMSVTAGQYRIRRGKHTIPYFSGKSQIIETTFDTFAHQVDVTKMVGYYSSSAVAPYNTVYDGFWIEQSASGPIIKVSNNGTIKASVNFADWDNYEKLVNYNWDNFTVLIWDFLWLGGTELRLFIKTTEGFVLAHTYKHASTKQGLFVLTPNHSVRYEIRSTTGVGSMNSICSQVSTEGAFPEAGKPNVLMNLQARSVGSVGTIYALKGIKKLASFRDIAITVTRASISNTGTSDTGTGLILLNPTLSAPLTYVTNGRVSDGTSVDGTLVTNVGRILAVIPAGTAGTVSGVNDSILASIPMDINNVSGEIVLAYMPTSSNQSVFGTLTVKIY